MREMLELSEQEKLDIFKAMINSNRGEWIRKLVKTKTKKEKIKYEDLIL